MRSVAIVLAVAAACTGPRLCVDNPHRHTVLVDGVETAEPVVPFRYFGTTAVDTLPAPRPNGRPDWERQPARTMVAIDAPASGWLFPLDLPIALLDRLFAGRGDTTVAATVAPSPPVAPPESELEDTRIAQLSRRAHAARTAR